MRPGPIDVGQIAARLPGGQQLPSGALGEQSGEHQEDPPKVNGNHGASPPDAHLSVAERLAQNRQRRQRGQQGQEASAAPAGSSGGPPGASAGLSGVTVVPLDFTLDLIHELTHNQRQYRPDKDTGGVNVSILHLPEVVGTALGRIKARVPIRCGIAPIITACVDWGLKGLGQYPAIQRLLWLKAVFNEREEAHRAGYEQEAGLARSRSGRSLYGLRGQCLQEIFRDFPAGLPESKWRENVYMPLDTYTDLKEVMVSGLGLEIQDAVILATMYTLVDVAGCEATKDVAVEDDRLEMRETLDRFLDHAQVRGEVAEFAMRGWGMLEKKEGDQR